APPVVRREDQPEIAQLGHLLHDVGRDLGGLVVQLGSNGRHLAAGAVAHALAVLHVRRRQRAAVRIGDGHQSPPVCGVAALFHAAGVAVRIQAPPYVARFLTRILRSYTQTSSPRWFTPVVRAWTMPR